LTLVVFECDNALKVEQKIHKHVDLERHHYDLELYSVDVFEAFMKVASSMAKDHATIIPGQKKCIPEIEETVMIPYDELHELDSDSCAELGQKSIVTPLEMQSVFRYEFDNVYLRNTLPHEQRIMLFDLVRTNRRYYKIMERLYLEHHKTPEEIANEDSNRKCSKAIKKRSVVFGQLRTICSLLELRNSHDGGRVITHEMLVEHGAALKLCLAAIDETKFIIDDYSKRATSENRKQQDPEVILANRISRLFMNLSGHWLQSKRRGNMNSDGVRVYDRTVVQKIDFADLLVNGIC
jgi:hypothetical protein